MTSNPPISDGGKDRDDEALAAEYALGVLDGAEKKAFHARLHAEPQLMTRVLVWQEALAEMDADSPLRQAPPKVKARLEATLFEKRARRLRWPWALAGALVAGLALLFLFVPFTRFQTDFGIELAATELSLRIDARIDADLALITAEKVAGDAPSGRAIELWAIVGDAAPVSLGVVGDEPLTVPLPSGVAPEGLILAISEEPLGGSPTGQPTGSVLATGTVQEF